MSKPAMLLLAILQGDRALNADLAVVAVEGPPLRVLPLPFIAVRGS